MSDLITCHAPIDMLRRCSPIIVEVGSLVEPANGAPFRVTHAEEALVYNVRDGVPMVTWDYPGTADVLEPVLEMDLTDATGRAHAAWWVAGSIKGQWQRCGRCWTALLGARQLFTGFTRFAVMGTIHVTSLANLNPTDDTRLPDGSRVVDALALKAVVEHLLTQRSAK